MTLFSSFFSASLLFTLFSANTLVSGLRYDAAEAEWNLNTNKKATHPLQYSTDDRTDGTNFTHHTSPPNWRIPTYTLFLDRFVNGDPTNDDKNETIYETDMMSTQLRFGGDLLGLQDSLDYIAGMGIKVHTPRNLDHRWWPDISDADIKMLGYLHRRLPIHQSAMGRGFIFGMSTIPCRHHPHANPSTSPST